MHRLILFVLIYFTAAAGMNAQHVNSCLPDPYPPHYFDHLTRESGLPSNTINCVIQDFLGFIWIGTTNGLARYDGHDMKIFRCIPGDSTSLVDNTVFALCQTADSLIWVGTGNGLSIYDQHAHSLRNYSFDGKKQKGFPVQWINSFFEDQPGSVWIGTREGIVHATAKGSHFEHFRTTKCNKPQDPDYYINVISFIRQDPRSSNALLLGTSAGLIRFDKAKKIVDQVYGGPPKRDKIIREMLLDSNHQLWVCGWGIGVGCFDLNTETWQAFSPVNWGITVLSMIPKGRDEFWLATDDRGLGVFNKKLHTFYFYKNNPENPRSISSDHIIGGAYFNDHRDFWIWGDGVDVENKDYFSFQQVKVPYKYWFINAFYKEQETGQLFVGAYHCKGIPVLDTKKQSWSLIPFDQPFPPEGLSVTQFYKDSKGRLWVSTRSGLCYFDPVANLLRTYRTPDGKPLHLGETHVVYGLNEDPEGNLWVGTRFDGVIRIDPSRTKTEYFKHIPGDPYSLLEGTHFIAVQTDNYNRVWLGCRFGVSIYDPVKRIFFNSLQDTLRKYGIIKSWINGIEKDSLDRMWLAIDGAGLVRVEVRANGSYGIKLFHSGNGLKDPGVGWITKDPESNLWVVDDGLQYFNPYRESFRIFDNQNGLHENPGGSQMVYIDHEGNVFIGDSIGYETRNLKTIHHAEKDALSLVLEALEVNGKENPGRSLNSSAATISLTADQNNLKFHYTAICFHHSGRIRYRYKLQGYDKQWMNGETSREARYTNLPPGQYTFRVSATQGIGWYDSRESIHIVIRPFFWQTWWFILLCLVVISIITTLIYRYRVNQLLKVERLRTRIAIDLHDDISSTLSSISILSDIAGKLSENPKSADMISEIGSNAHDMLERIDDIIWSVNPVNDKFQDLGLRIKEYANPLFESKNIQFRFEIPDKLATLKLQMETRRNLYLIAKESINNLVKYSKCRTAEVCFREESGHLVMEIRDDGIGFNPGVLTSRNGIVNMKLRAEKIGGVLYIQSQSGEGTRISLRVKII